MGISASILAIPFFNRLIKLNREINGHWFQYFTSLIQLIRRRKEIKNRVVTHDVWSDSIRDTGVLPFPHEWTYDCPDKTKSENLLIYGVNSSKQSIKIEIKWRVNPNNENTRNAKISLRLDDSDGSHYTLEDESEVEYKSNEYKVCGLAVEILSPFRRKRIRFRGYLTKDDGKLVYVTFRFLWSPISKVYDFTSDFDDYFMAKEWAKSRKRQYEQQFEDSLEQFGYMKGTFNEENCNERVLYFWGSINKKYLENKPIKRRIIRIIGYNKNGIGFNLGFLSNNNGFEYRFGYLSDRSKWIRKLTKLSIFKQEFEDLLRNGSSISFKGLFADKEYEFQIKENKNSLAKDLTVNGIEGMCYILEDIENEFQQKVNKIKISAKDSSLVLGLNEENAKSVQLTGGKGSSLAVLMTLSEELIKENYENKFIVANGVVVTTNAYQTLLGEYKDLENGINELEKSTDCPKDELKTKCENLVNLISKQKLPEIIGKEIENKMKQNFNDFENKLFAVRSSGASEDSEAMSAAGQMSTYLGVKGLENIKQSVMKCWSSQFSRIAYEYKRGYGQTINTPMAVIIQEMIACESAGVMFTCDPITGDERLIEITANYGLGESVVSASSEPDTIKLSVNIESNSLVKRRTIKAIESKVIGAKKTLIKLSENGGTVEEEVTDQGNCCISDEELKRLGDLGLRIHRYYGNPRDIEWGVKGGQIFILQSRPVTNLENYTEYEVMHELDTPHQTEFEIYSRAHWGENFPGSSSWLLFTWTMANKSRFFRFGIMAGLANAEDYNPYTAGMGIQYNQFMFNITNGSFGTFTDYPESKRSQQMVLAFFGHHIEDEDVLKVFREATKAMKKPSIFGKLKMMFGLTSMLLFGPKNLIKTKTQYMDELKYDMVENVKGKKTPKDILMAISIENEILSEAQFKNHGPASMGSSLKNMLLRSALEGAMENNPNFESDFNLLMSSCTDVISAEVPNILRDIAIAIKDKKQFVQMSDEEALKTLRNGTDEASQMFGQFLIRHGHRGYREADPMHPPWVDDPIPCIKTIKGMLSGSNSQLEPKVEKSVDEVINELKTPLSFTRKLLIRKLLLPWSRSGVGYRELSKYFMIWGVNKLRQAFRFLAKRMVSEGLIPSEDIIFYLTSEEIELLCDGHRDPLILMRARNRKRIYPKMNKYKFDEFIKGPEMKPRNFEEQIIDIKLTNGLLQMSGTPVSIGSVKARVCVSEDITEADQIQSGDILITYSTDIGWSPYFPLLSGIVTEIGGTISHGAVIAREYGIPSLIAVEGACRAFRTGDICILDTPSATITKVC